MLFILLYRQILSSSVRSQTLSLPPTQDTLPHLIALEPTDIHQEITSTPISQIITIKPSMEPTQIAVSSTPTPLVLFDEQQSEVMGYSMEGRPLKIYKFGNGEHERMIVAGIHGGDEWNTIT